MHNMRLINSKEGALGWGVYLHTEELTQENEDLAFIIRPVSLFSRFSQTSFLFLLGPSQIIAKI